MIIFLYGDDDFRSKRKLEQIISRYKSVHKTGLNLKFFDFEEKAKEDTFENIRNQFRMRSMFKEKKLFVLKNAFSDNLFKKKFLENKEDFLSSEDVIAFYEKRDFPKKGSFFSFLEKKTLAQKFKPLEGKSLKDWVAKELEGYSIEISPEAKSLLIEYTGNNLWRLHNEIEKLACYKKGEIVEKKDIELMVSPEIQANIFKTIDFLALKDKEKALSLMHTHLEKGDSPLYLLSMINFQFRNLLVIKEKIASGKSTRGLGWHPFVVRKSAQLSKNFTLEELKKIYQKIFEADLDIKSGKVEPEAALDLLISGI